MRRLEYRVLYPSRDEYGILRFDESELDRALRDPESFRLFARSRGLEERMRDAARRHGETPFGSARTTRARAANTAKVNTDVADDLPAALHEVPPP